LVVRRWSSAKIINQQREGRTAPTTNDDMFKPSKDLDKRDRIVKRILASCVMDSM